MTLLGQPVPFPSKDAAIVRKAAGMANHKPSLDALGLVHDMIGNPANVQRVVSGWEACIRSMNDSYGSASQAHSQALARWEGGAAAAFGAYAADVKTVITNNVTMFQGTLDAVSKMYEAVIEAYKQAITFVSKCAQSLLDFGGGLLGDWKALLAVVGAAPTDGASLALILKHFTDLLSSFVDNVTNLINGVIETGKNFTVALSSSLRNVGAVRPVPGPTKGVLDLGAWTPA